MADSFIIPQDGNRMLTKNLMVHLRMQWQLSRKHGMNMLKNTSVLLTMKYRNIVREENHVSSGIMPMK